MQPCPVTPASSAASLRRREWQITWPSFGWLLVFFAIPTAIIFVISFRQADFSGGIGTSWTLNNWAAWAQPQVRVLLWRTVWISAAATAICLAVAVPMAWFMARCGSLWRNVILLLVVIPFWTNFLIRVFAWKVLLNAESPFSQFLRAAGLLGDGESLLYTQGAVLLVTVYAHLPFAILPLYAAAEKFDFSLLDAARDLGATASRAFLSVFLPGIRTGIAAACLLVFVPALGSYLIPDLVGGQASDMLGNRIAQRAFADRNLPEASALASGLALAVIGAAFLIWRREKK